MVLEWYEVFFSRILIPATFRQEDAAPASNLITIHSPRKILSGA